MSILNQEAPPAEAPKSGEFIKLDPFPKSDSYVLTVVAFNYIPEHDFERKDEKTGEEYIKKAPAIEFFFGALVDGKAFFVKSWPQMYSLSERANYYKWYEAATGKPPTAGTKPNDTVGKYVLGTLKVEDKKSQKGTAYRVTTIKAIAPVPSILASAGVPLAQLRPALDAALAAQGDKKEEAQF